MTEIHSSGPDQPISSRDRKMYEQEFKHAAGLFERALQQHEKSDNPYQKQEFKEVMDKALRVLNETAQELTRRELLKQNQQIAQDYSAYQADGSEKTAAKLRDDLESAKRSV